MSILKEILSATGEKKKGPKESDDQFRTRIFAALNTMSDDDWADLSDPAQNWSNAAGEATKKNKPLPDFDIEEEEEEDESEGSEIEFGELEEGQEVTIKSGTGKELAKGEVSAVTKKSVTILGDDGEETEVAKAKAATIVLHGAAADDEEEEEEEEKPKGRRQSAGRRDEDTKSKAKAKSKKKDDDDEEEEEEEDETPKSKKKADKKPTGKKAAKDDDDDEEEEEEELEQWENEIEQDDVKVGMTVQLYFEEDESLVQGEVTKVGPKGIFIDGERYMKDDITNVYVEEEEEEEEDEAPKSKKKAGAKAIPKRGKKIVEDGDEEEEEEEEESDDDAGAELPFKKLKKDMTVTVHLKDGSSVSGDITRLGMPDGKTLKGIFIDGERIAVVKIDKVTEGAAPKKKGAAKKEAPKRGAKDDDEDDDKASGKKAKTGVVQAIKEVCCKFPALSEEKVQARLEKAGHEVNPSTLKMTYKDVHMVIDMLRENGKLA